MKLHGKYKTNKVIYIKELSLNKVQKLEFDVRFLFFGCSHFYLEKLKLKVKIKN